jgi:hypothetical protein
MNVGPGPPVTPWDRVKDVPRILDALRLAVADALMRHKRAGQPIAIWRDGNVVWIAPDEIPMDEVSSKQAAPFERPEG